MTSYIMAALLQIVDPTHGTLSQGFELREREAKGVHGPDFMCAVARLGDSVAVACGTGKKPDFEMIVPCNGTIVKQYWKEREVKLACKPRGEKA